MMGNYGYVCRIANWLESQMQMPMEMQWPMKMLTRATVNANANANTNANSFALYLHGDVKSAIPHFLESVRLAPRNAQNLCGTSMVLWQYGKSACTLLR